MTLPINANLARINLPTVSSSQLHKLLVIGDSQTLRQSNRAMGQFQKWPVEHVGLMAYSVNQQSVGSFYSEVSGSAYGATITTTRVDDVDDWGDGNTSDHLGWGNKWDVAGTISPNFSELGRYAISSGGFATAFDLDARKNARVILRDQSGGMARMRLQEYRDSTLGNSEDFGISGDPVVFDQSGALRILNQEVRAAGVLGSTSGSPVGVVVKDSNNSDTNKSLSILGALIYNSPSGEAFPSSGLIAANVGHAGWSAYDHVNRQSSAARTALCAAMEGVDLIMIMLGHNAEDAGTYRDNIQAIINAWNVTHAGQGYNSPDYCLVAPWRSDASSMNGSNGPSKVSDLYGIAKSGGHGFINLFGSYGGVEIDGRTVQLDGTATTYTMDGSNLHPNDAATAESIADDIWWHFQPENFDSETPIAGSRSRRTRMRQHR